MTLTIKVGSLTILSTEVTTPASVAIEFKGSRWFGFSIAVSFTDADGRAVSLVRTEG